MTEPMTDNPTDTGALLPVTPDDRNLFKLIITGMVGPTKHNAIDGGGFDTDERMQAIARHRHQSETGAALTSAPTQRMAEILGAPFVRAAQPVGSETCAVCGIANRNHFTHGAPFGPDYHEYVAQPVEAGEDGLAKHTFVTCVSGDGPTPYLKVHFNTLADAHAAHDQLLGTSRGAK